jgi:septal ring-binding cell division protein DamX
LKLTDSPPSANDLLEQRLLATERWLAEAQGGTFSIQLLGSNDPALLRNYFETLGKYIELEKVFVYRTLANQQPSMTVLYGVFGSRADAVRSLEALPDELKTNRPYIRTVQGVRSEIGLRKRS